MALELVSLNELDIDDDRSLGHIAVYRDLKALLLASGCRFYRPKAGTPMSWDRALFLNLTFWDGAGSADVLCDQHIPADVVAHVAWHHVVGAKLARTESGVEQRRSPDAMLLAEAIASAFDLYLVGRMLKNAPESDFITSQVPVMAEAAEEAGMPEDRFMDLMEQVSREPERAFEDLRALLFDICTELLRCSGPQQAEAVLERYALHRFAALLHHFQLSNWILYARAYGAPGVNESVAQADAEMRRSQDSLGWLTEHWLATFRTSQRGS